MGLALDDNDLRRWMLWVFFAAHNFCGLPTLFSVGCVIDHFGPISQHAESFAFDDTEMCEDILILGPDDKPEALAWVKPLDHTFRISNFLRLFFRHRILQRDSVTPSRAKAMCHHDQSLQYTIKD